jgi:hypothetical protein
MDEPLKKKVDESWKEQTDREKHHVSAPPAAEQAAGSAPLAGGGPPLASPSPPPSGEVTPGAAQPEPARAATAEAPPAPRFDLLVSGMAMEAFVALGDMPHPATRRQAVQLPQAKYLIDLLGVLEEKTRGNLTVDEERLLKDALYQLRLRYLSKAGG